MKNRIGIRRENLSKKGEKRVAVTPALAKEIVANGNDLFVQPAQEPQSGEIKRAYPDQGYIDAGASICEDISKADVIFGLKEIDIDDILADKAYLFFSHTHKAQVKNRKMLQTLVDRRVTAIDYELITREDGARVITAFTYFAGYAGMIDTLWAYGKRLKDKGISNPFESIPQSIEKEDLGLIKNLIKEAGQEIRKNGTPSNLPPLINCILGTGKTSTGSQTIYDLLPVESISLSQLEDTYKNGDRKRVYKLVLDLEEMFRLKPDAPYSSEDYHSLDKKAKWQLYFDHPSYFEGNLDQVLPYCSILMNCILWGPEYPRTLTKDLMETLWKAGTALEAIGDITCDPNGSIEFSKETWIDDPVYIYNPLSRELKDGFEGEGVAVMAVTNLPCEFSADASQDFSDNIKDILKNLLDADFTGTWENSGLCDEFKNAVILWQGEFTPKYTYMKEYLPA